jgi:large subunit ribosomal protein L15e
MKKAYQYIKENIEKGIKDKKIEWRKQNSVIKIDKPTNLARARNLGYKDKKGIIVTRVRVLRGGHKRARPNKGRKVRNLTIRKSLSLSYQRIAEQRASKKFPNLEVLNSYKIAKDGKNYWFEIIMIDKKRPEVLKDKNLSWVSKNKHKGRVQRGLTSSGKKSRRLSKK